MKMRNGFVSNSSSASFIIRWRFDGEPENEKNAFDEAFCLLFDVGHGEDYAPDFSIWKDMKEIYDELRKKTKYEGHGEFESAFWTCMYNDIQDFGPAAAYLNLALDINEGNAIRLVRRSVVDD